MSTLRNLLVNNPRVKEILQMRKTLGEAFPYTDWTKVPVKHYSKFLSLKDLIGECGVVWTNAFKRSNTEAEDTRKYLKDYSGNERDIELFNFGWADESGYKNGAIISDGVDDYGQCIKDFALPDDYTVVAMREILGRVSGGCIVSKSRNSSNGAFRFEQVVTTGDDICAACYNNVQLVSEGDIPKLFSYQTRTSYNGRMTLAPGTGTDTTEDKLCVFIRRPSVITSISAALYSFGIFNRTLTEEELALVEDCMYLELEYNTTILDNIEYYDILDARYRSNEEAEDKRNKWNGRLGKLHLTLNNYAYSQMSGWNGTRYNFKSLENISTVIGNKITITHAYSGINTYSVNPPIVDNILSLRAKFTGIDRLVQSGEITGVYLLASDSSGDTLKFGTQATKDGIIELSVDVNGVEGVARASLFVDLKNTQGATLIPLSSPITIDVIPDYGGALVSDGVDDTADSAETIDEEIGGFVCHAEAIGGSYCFFSGPGFNTAYPNSIGIRSDGSGLIHLGQPEKAEQPNSNGIYAFSKTPLAPDSTLSIHRATSEYGSWALHQLRLLKTQPSDLQLEVIKHQVLMEHNDYVKEMGWN